ncbi:uracil-DNA glycosylase [Mucilaginibacter achroorhodeus]|uniref:Uracil-DNA glycosylase n=1 Tax=Mucilaginibacter achroorhodeus TaxID=2599294 RepID=A0A563UAI6_9SPHI|nr:uracil-DNA glycosylase family protein [Mucilaginibacter achroorhodeus]TWR28354.1 uracil-DNA glycosylase [Mucilaginibacter achroorhodeus]
MISFSEFDNLCMKVQSCILCTRMCDSLKVLNRSSGSLNAEIMFIGEAPGRLGADSSGIPFHGDKAGHNFEDLLKIADINRSNIFVTNAVLCNPKDEAGNNSTPTKQEIINCANFLAEQIILINPKIVVTLGRVALESLNYISEHKLSLKDSVRSSNSWFNRILIPFYHPGQRAMLHRSMANQRSDYQFLSEELKRLNKNHFKKNLPASKLEVAAIINYLFQRKNTYTYFALHKLFYLIEYNSILIFGRRLTNSYIIRQKDGPYCTDLHLTKIKKALPFIGSKILSNTNILLFKTSVELFDTYEHLELEDGVKRFIDQVLEKHGDKSNIALKKTVYFSRPMRDILMAERDNKINLYNTPIL